MRILVLNWRDIKNPRAGGAENFTHEIAKRWVQWGHEVTLFTSTFPGAPMVELIDGIRIIRAGGQLSVVYHSWKHYKEFFKGNYDVVIEEFNGILPWFCRYFMSEPVIVLRHQNDRGVKKFEPRNSVLFYEIPAGLNVLVYILERHFLLHLKGLPLMVVSDSTKNDFYDLGFDPKDIMVVPEGTSAKTLPEPGNKEKVPTIISVGRLKRFKRVDDILLATKHVMANHPDVQLWVVGRGDSFYEKQLKQMVKKIGISKNTKFFGYVTNEKRDDLMSRAHVFVMASIREGWGLVVTEANALWTPAVGYDVPGLRDSIVDGKTGLLAKNGEPKALGKAIDRMLSDEGLRKKMAKAGWERSKTLTWDRSAKVCLDAVYSGLSRNYGVKIAPIDAHQKKVEPDPPKYLEKNVLSFHLESWVHRDHVDASSSKKKKLDEGNVVNSTQEVLGLLKAYTVKTTFFVVGEIFDWYPELISDIKSQGHEIAFQSQTHKVLQNKSILLEELKMGKRFIDEFQPKGFRAPHMFMKKEYLKILKDHGFSYDTSIYSNKGIFSPIDNMIEFPVSTYPRIGRNPRYGFPRPLNINLLLHEVPYGSGYYIGLLGPGVGKYIERSNLEGRPSNLFVHNWQVLEQVCETKVRGPGAMNRLLMGPYHKKREAALVSLFENFKFVPMQTIIKDAEYEKSSSESSSKEGKPS